MSGQVIGIAAHATSFTAVCDRCAELDAREGWSGPTFAGRLDLDLDTGVFLCRRGHQVRVMRAEPQGQTELAAAS
ncbi:MAG TPA: hypothetical protein VFM96_04190 [Gaiellaceae bacterium]|nr:hypothetical protein [Gaiellaceae bacterium]